MSQTQIAARLLSDRLCRPQRIGVFGRRGVGKTTFLTMLYREAVGGRLPGLRLAAADARTAEYLADKILQLESGQPLPATLGETDLHFHLYFQGSQFDLLLKDYQGEHVAVGREEPIRDFLRDCDAVWLCLDVNAIGPIDTCLHAQQEVEQLVEDYLSSQPPATPHRPMALVLTKADLLRLEESFTASPEDAMALTALVHERLAMTRHALESHCPQHAVMAVSSLGQPFMPAPEPVFQPQPTNLAEPLLWLAQALQAQDEARLEQLWKLEPNNHALLEGCVDCFARRYPGTAAARTHQKRVRQLRRQQRQRRLLVAATSLLAVVLALWSYDALGRSRTESFAAAHPDDPAAVKQHWLSHQRWHPTRHLFLSGGAHAEDERLRVLDAQVRDRQAGERLADLRRRSADPDGDPEAVWELFRQYREEFPERDIDGDRTDFRTTLKARRDAERRRKAAAAFDELTRTESQATVAEQIAHAQRFLKDFADSSEVSDVKLRLTAYLRRQDEAVFEAARAYSARNPFNFHTRREHYQKYLQQYPRGVYAREARDAVAAVVTEWDKYDFRAIRDQFQDKPAELKDLDAHCRAYLAAHPDGQYRDAVTALLRWSERVRAENEYKVVLKHGSFDPKSAAYLSRGLYLSVELEVNGVSYGPSTIVKRDSEPEWNYEFPRPVKWKMGDRVRIKVIDNYYWRRTVLDLSSDDGDPLAMKLLSGTAASGKHSVVFESDFGMPVLPKVE